MTSAKHFRNWIKEAGRGHVIFFASSGGFFVYTVLAAFGIRNDSYSFFFGIGNETLLYLCMGLGILAASAGFWYLEQPVKLDFYYSLPVKRGTVFWSRYVHGILHVIFPLFISMVVLTIYECSINQEFVPYAGSYMSKSVALYFAVFLIFYHISIASFLAGGRAVGAALLFVISAYAGQAVFQGIGKAYAKHFFKTFYRIPALETMKEMLTPGLLSRELSGISLYDKREVLEYVPGKGSLLAAFLWILLFLILMACLEQKRKVENVGRVFAFPAVERVILFFLSAVLALCLGTFFMGSSIFLVIIFHILGEFLIYRQGRKIFERKWIMAAECAVVLLVTGGFAAGAQIFDGIFPERDEIRAVSICVNGVDMSQEESRKNSLGEESYETERKLEQYRFTEDGLSEGLSWIKSLKKEADPYTFVTVCYQMEDGRERYRVYPVSEEDFQSFAMVFETREFKEKAYPALSWEHVGDNRFAWKDGVKSQVLKLTKEEKEAFLKLYKEEVMTFRMEELKEAAPAGIVEMRSEKWGETQELLIYPFFEKTFAFLKEHGEIREDLFDYPVRSLKVRNTDPTDGSVSGGARTESYEAEEELERWREKLIWAELDAQSLLYPLGYRGGIEAEVEEPESGALVKVRCCERTGNGAGF